MCVCHCCTVIIAELQDLTEELFLERKLRGRSRQSQGVTFGILTQIYPKHIQACYTQRNVDRCLSVPHPSHETKEVNGSWKHLNSESSCLLSDLLCTAVSAPCMLTGHLQVTQSQTSSFRHNPKEEEEVNPPSYCQQCTNTYCCFSSLCVMPLVGCALERAEV